MRLRFASILLILSIVFSGICGIGGASTASAAVTTSLSKSNLVPVCVFYYGGFSATIKQRLIATAPEFVVLNTPGGSYKGHISAPTPSDIAQLKAAGIKVISYINTGNMVNFQYASDSPQSDRDYVRGCIATVAAEGCDGIFFDEGGVGYHPSHADRYLTAPRSDLYGNSNSWYGYTIEDYASYCHSFGMLAIEGTDFNEPQYLNTNVFDIFDYILTDEVYPDKLGYDAAGSEVGHESQCWVIGTGRTVATTAASISNAALSRGYGAVYQCNNYGVLSDWYENYISLLTPSSITYTVTIAVNGSGTTNPAAGTYQFPPKNVTIQATPASGWQFANWSNGSTVNPISLDITGNASITANFVQSTTTYSLVSSVTGSGTIQPYAPGTYSVPAGTAVTMTATPSTGYVFSRWTGDVSGTANPVTFQVNSNMNVQAVFNQVLVTLPESSGKTYQLTVSTQGQGTTSMAPGTYAIQANQQVTMTATPVAGWTFRSWSWLGNDPNYSGWSENPVTWNMAEPISIVAIFDQIYVTSPVLTPTSPLPKIVTTALPSGQVGTAYNQTLAATDGTVPYTWAIISGTLPTGLIFSPEGIISGTPTIAGTSIFTIQLADGSSPSPSKASKTLSITVTSKTTVETNTPTNTGRRNTIPRWYANYVWW